MNRAYKRLQAKQEAAAERERARQAPITKPAGGAGGARGGRFGTGLSGRQPGAERGEREGRLKRMFRFLREVRAELKKVAWPSRQEVFTYTVVVLVSVTFITLFTFGLDYLFGKGVLTFFKS